MFSFLEKRKGYLKIKYPPMGIYIFIKRWESQIFAGGADPMGTLIKNSPPYLYIYKFIYRILIYDIAYMNI